MSRDIKLVTLALFLWGSGEGLFIYIMPLYMEQLGATPQAVGAVLGLAAFLAACSFIPGGILADRFDAKKVMIWGWAIGAVASLGMGLAPTWLWFVPWVLIYNVSAYCIPAINTYIAEASGDIPLEHTITVTFAGYAAGSIVSPFIGGRLSAAWGTAPLFIIAAIIFGLSFLIALKVSSHAPHLNYAKARQHSPRQQFARLRPLTASYARLFFVFFTVLVGTILPANYLGTLSWDISDVNSLGGTANAIGALILSLMLGRVAAGRRRRGLLLSQGLAFTAMILFTLSTPSLRGLPIAAYFLLGAVPTLRELSNAQLAGQVDHDLRGTTLGMNETIFALARSLAALLAGALFALNPRGPFIAAIALIPIGMVLIARLRPVPARADVIVMATTSHVIIETLDD
jgi:MFS transporter, DHA1 family, tetracycline resistance protein